MAITRRQRLESLFDALAEGLEDAIRNGVQVLDKDGKIHRVTCPHGFYKEARELLKDNNIQALETPGTPLYKLAHGLPFGQEELEAAGKLSVEH